MGDARQFKSSLLGYTLYSDLRKASSTLPAELGGPSEPNENYRMLWGSAMILLASTLYSVNGELYKAEVRPCQLIVNCADCASLFRLLGRRSGDCISPIW